MRVYGLLVLVLTVFCSSIYAQTLHDWWGLTQKSYYRPLSVEAHPTEFQIKPLCIIKDYAYSRPNDADGYRAVIELNFGKELPIIGYDFYRGDDFESDRASFSIGLWIPISIHVLWDAFDSTTAPIVNNDYRFTYGTLKAIYRFRGHDHAIRNIALKFTPYGHESTHLGDELTIYANMHFPDFKRINVSYEYWELGLSFNDLDKRVEKNNLMLRLGLWGLHHRDRGFYTTDTTETNGQIVHASKRYMEYYLNLSYDNFLLSNFIRHNKKLKTKFGWMNFLSLELSNRIVYNYDKQFINELEQRAWNLNIMFGYKYNPEGKPNLQPLSIFIGYYYGMNPHGQLREQNNWYNIYMGFKTSF